MSKKLSEEEFQQLVVEELGTLRRDVATIRSNGDKFQQFVAEHFGMFATDLTAVRADLASVRDEITEIKDILEPLAKAFDNDAETIIEHDRRISRLEEHVGIPKRA